jgi:hypothetical protein
MQLIETEFDAYNYHFTQLERQGAIAIYQQQHKEHPKVIRYEVIRIRIQPERIWPDGRVTPEREAYPGSSVWGKDGFTCHTLDQAKALAAQLQTQAGTLEQGEEDPGDAGDTAQLQVEQA